MTAPFSLKTTRLTLRPVRTSDVDRIAFLLNHFAVAGNLASVAYPYSCELARTYVQSQPESPGPREIEFAIDLGDHGMIGAIGWHRDGGGEPELGYYLGLPYWGRGLMTEAATAAIGWFFAEGRDEAMLSGYFTANKASARIEARLGFTETGRSLRHCLARGEQVRHIDTKLTRTAWAETAKTRQAS